MKSFIRKSKMIFFIAATLGAMTSSAHAELGYGFDSAPVSSVGMDTNRESHPTDGTMWIVVTLPSGVAANSCEAVDGGTHYGYGSVDLSGTYAKQILSMGQEAIGKGLPINMEVDLENGCTIMNISLNPAP